MCNNVRILCLKYFPTHLQAIRDLLLHCTSILQLTSIGIESLQAVAYLEVWARREASLERGPLIVTQAWYNIGHNCYDAKKSEPVAELGCPAQSLKWETSGKSRTLLICVSSFCSFLTVMTLALQTSCDGSNNSGVWERSPQPPEANGGLGIRPQMHCISLLTWSKQQWRFSRAGIFPANQSFYNTF